LTKFYQQAENTHHSNAIFYLFSPIEDPKYFEEAVKEEKWFKAMDEEIHAIMKNDTWELRELPKGK